MRFRPTTVPILLACLLAGAALSADCDSCHLIVAQGPTDDLGDVDSDVAGLEFEHPVQIGEAWKAVPCAQCHTRASGY